MFFPTDLDHALTSLARRALFITLGLTSFASLLGIVGSSHGKVDGAEAVLVYCTFAFSFGLLFTLIALRNTSFQTVGALATGFFWLVICAGTVISIYGHGEHLHFLGYMLWFFPLLAFSRLVNRPPVGRPLAKVLVITPLILVACLLPKWVTVLNIEQQILLSIYCFSYTCYASTLSLTHRFREQYIVNRERIGSLKIEAAILESISDCFISLDSNNRLVYLNDAACLELKVERQEALNHTLSQAAPSFLSAVVLAELEATSTRDFASFFEVMSEDGSLWYDLRCFPRLGGLSIYFRNITKSMLSRMTLEEAHKSMRKQAELLDKAQDAIYVVSVDAQIVYWNKGAERLYGWRSEEVLGKPAEDVFQYRSVELDNRIGTILRQGEWIGEIRQSRRDGSTLMVESRCTVVEAEDGGPQSLLVINTDITARKENEARIEYLAFYDVLTDLPNRQLLRDKLTDVLIDPSHGNKVGVLFYVDLDDFRNLNDTMGHDFGDLLIVQVAGRLRSCLGPLDVLARLGGDEFIIMLADLYEDIHTATAAAQTAGNKVLEIFHNPFVLGTYESETKASIGATLFICASDTVDQLFKRTDLAMYQAKARGRNGLCFFDPSMQTDIDNRSELRSDLRRALQNEEFQLHYQPQVDSTASVIGCEALLRWVHPVRGRVPPDQFIPLAEEAGLIVDLGRWVLETACRQIAIWAASPLTEHLTVAVNVSVRQFLDPHFVNLVRETLRTSGANPHRLKLEVTESSTMEDIRQVIAVMTDIKSDGVSFSLDDFGTGYSSLSHLQHLPLDQLKIDRSFVNNVLTHEKDASIARTIILLGNSLHLSVIAEGVETEEQRLFLESEGCYLYQGFLYSPAVPISGFENFLITSVRGITADVTGTSTNKKLGPEAAIVQGD